jgi:hypothetical protein
MGECKQAPQQELSVHHFSAAAGQHLGVQHRYQPELA